jgi:hypothetical protein
MSSSKNRINSQINQLLTTQIKNVRGNTADFSAQDVIATQADASDSEAVSFALLEDVDEVQPGDLITAELMNELLSRLMRLEAIVLNLAHPDKGKVKVPNLFGVNLNQARTLLTNQHLRVGKVLDIFGRTVGSTSSLHLTAREAVRSEQFKLALEQYTTLKGRTHTPEETVLQAMVTSVGVPIVLAHFPVPGAMVGAGATVNLLVTFNATASAGNLALLLEHETRTALNQTNDGVAQVAEVAQQGRRESASSDAQADATTDAAAQEETSQPAAKASQSKAETTAKNEQPQTKNDQPQTSAGDKSGEMKPGN